MITIGAFDFVPIEFRGVSFLTIIFIILIGISGRIMYYILKKEIDLIKIKVEEVVEDFDKKKNTEDFNDKIENTNSKVDTLSRKIDATNSDLIIIKTHVAGIHEAVEWIKKYIQAK